MKKICFIVGDLNCSGGTERVTSLIANELAKYNYEICILSLKNGDKPFFSLDNSIKTSSLFSREVSFKKSFISTVWGIRNYVKINKINTVVSV
ncbi:glycosyltransferase family 4 protein, partial [Acinetobacter variabilis]